MEKLEKIIKYLDGEVIGEEKTSLENEIANNPQMQELLAFVKKIDHIIGDEDMVNFITKLDQTQADFRSKPVNNNDFTNHNPSSKSHSRLLHKQLVLVAAIIAIALISSILFYTSTPLNEKLYNRFYTTYEASVVTRSDNKETDDLVMAIQLYDKKQYDDAILKFNKILTIDRNNTAALFFISVSCIEIKDFNKAIENLNQIITGQDDAFLEHAEWYLALCYIKTNRLAEANKIISQIKTSDSYYRTLASDLSIKLN